MTLFSHKITPMTLFSHKITPMALFCHKITPMTKLPKSTRVSPPLPAEYIKDDCPEVVRLYPVCDRFGIGFGNTPMESRNDASTKALQNLEYESPKFFRPM